MTKSGFHPTPTDFNVSGFAEVIIFLIKNITSSVFQSTDSYNVKMNISTVLANSKKSKNKNPFQLDGRES